MKLQMFLKKKKQLAMVLRYVINYKVYECFTGFIELQSCTAESITNSILNHLTDIGINANNLVGQGYDGASTMAGHVTGVQTRIREKYPRAIYIHCSSHLLNLAVNDQNKVAEVRRTCDVVRSTINYFKESYNRQQLLAGASVPSFCPTR